MNKLKISKTQIENALRIQRIAGRNRGNNKYEWENSVEMRWKISNNRIMFDGFLCPQGTSYPDSNYIAIKCMENPIDNSGYDADKLSVGQAEQLCYIEDIIDRNYYDVSECEIINLVETFNELNELNELENHNEEDMLAQLNEINEEGI